MTAPGGLFTTAAVTGIASSTERLPERHHKPRVDDRSLSGDERRRADSAAKVRRDERCRVGRCTAQPARSTRHRTSTRASAHLEGRAWNARIPASGRIAANLHAGVGPEQPARNQPHAHFSNDPFRAPASRLRSLRGTAGDGEGGEVRSTLGLLPRDHRGAQLAAQPHHRDQRDRDDGRQQRGRPALVITLVTSTSARRALVAGGPTSAPITNFRLPRATAPSRVRPRRTPRRSATDPAGGVRSVASALRW